MQDALKNYLAIATGLSEVSKKKAKAAAKKLAKSGGATVEQVQALTEDLLATGLANRESLVNLVRYEVDRALGAVGLATQDEVEQLTGRIRELERALRATEVGEKPASTGAALADAAATARKAPAKKKTVAKVATKSVAKTATKAVATVPATANGATAPAAATPAPATAAPATPAPAPAKKAAPAKNAKAAPAKKAAVTKKATPATVQPAKSISPAKKVVAKKTAIAKSTPAKKATGNGAQAPGAGA